MLFLRGVWWRRGFSLSVLLVGLVAAAVAALGPLYARAASESTLTDELRQAGYRTGLAFTLPRHTGDAHATGAARRAVGAGAHLPGYSAPVEGEHVPLTTVRNAAGRFTPLAPMAWRTDVCAHLQLVSGRCPTRTGEAMVDVVAVSGGPRWHLGDRLTLHQAIPLPLPDVGFRNGPLLAGGLRIVGTYRPRDLADGYWFDLPFFNARLGHSVNTAITDETDAVFVVPQQFARAPSPVPDVVDFDVPLTPTRVRLDDVPALRREVAAVQARFPTTSKNPATPTMRTVLPAALRHAARDRDQVQTATLVVVLELAALSLVALFYVVRAAVAARGDEIALAKVRGLRPRQAVLLAVGEPLAVLALALPLGLALAWGATVAMTRSALVGGTPVTVTAAAGWALLVALGGMAVAATLSAVQVVTRPVLDQWRNTVSGRSQGRRLLAFDLAVAVAAVVIVVTLRSGEGARPHPLFLLTPALVALAVALVGARLLPVACRRSLRRTRASRRLVAFLALRQTVRRPGGLRLATFLAVAVGLATFAVCGEAVARANRQARAETELGAPTQLSVLDEPGHDPQAAVDAADPHGRWAMTAASWSPDGGSDTGAGATIVGTLLGVQPGRLAATAYGVRGQVPPATIARAITAPTARVANLRGTGVTVRLDTTALVGDRPSVRIAVRRGHSPAVQLDAGALRPGVHDYTAPVDCRAGCTFAGLVFTPSVTAQPVLTATTTLTAVGATAATGSTPVPVDLTASSSWRSSGLGDGAGVRTAAVAGGLRVLVRSTGGGSPILNYADVPAGVPVVAGPRSVTGEGTGTVSDFTNTTLAYHVARTVNPLPVQLDNGAIADLDYLRSTLPDFARESTWTVWLGRHAPRDAVQRLTRAGLLVQSRRTAGARSAQLAREGPALGLLLLLVCAVAAAVLGVGGTAVSVLSQARRRSYEFAALRAVGVRVRSLRRSAVTEQALLLGVGVILGVPAGYLAADLVLPVVPEFSDLTPVVLRYEPPVLVALGCALVFAVLLCLSALAGGRALLRGAVASRLREAP